MVVLCSATQLPRACAGHESIRRALVEHAPKLAACCSSRPDAAKELLQHIIALMHDRSWRVRYCAATHAHELSRTYGPDVTRHALHPDVHANNFMLPLPDLDSCLPPKKLRLSLA